MRKITLGSIVTATLLLVGCGGGGSSSTPTNNLADNTNSGNTTPSEISKKIGRGYYVDSAVEGVDYNCGNQNGVTDENGTFLFEDGKNCEFHLGDIKLRDINASNLEDNITIIEDNITVAKLLQTIDKDGNATNGIQILEDTADIIKESNIDTIPTEDALLDTIRENIKAKHQDEYNGTVITTEEAKAHIEHTQTLLEEEGRRTQHSPNEMGVTYSDEHNDSVEIDGEENILNHNNMREEDNETTHNQAQNGMNEIEESGSEMINQTQEHENNSYQNSTNGVMQGHVEDSNSASTSNNHENSSNENENRENSSISSDFTQNPMNSNREDSSENNNNSSNSDDSVDNEGSSNSSSSNSDDGGNSGSSSSGSSNSSSSSNGNGGSHTPFSMR